MRRDETVRVGGDTIAAWVWAPEDAGDDPRPCVVLAHGFGATREARLAAYAERFAASGLVAVAFDYRHFGGSSGEPRHVMDPARQQEDWDAVLAHVRGMAGVDARRIAVWGSSFGGGHAILVAARHPDLAAAISQVPFVDGLTLPRFTPPRTLVALGVAGVRDEAARLTGRERVRVPIVGPPGSVAAMTAPDAEPGYRAMLEPGANWTNDVTAGMALRLPLFRPIAAAARVRCPLLVCVAEKDAVALPGPAVDVVRRAPRAELRTYPCGHFEPYRGEWFERFVADQTDFLVRHLRP